MGAVDYRIHCNFKGQSGVTPGSRPLLSDDTTSIGARMKKNKDR